MSHSHSRPSSSASHNSRIPVRTSYKDNGHDIYHPHKRPGSTDSGTSVGSTNPLGLEHNLGVGRGASIKSGSRPKSLNLGGAGNISFYPAGSLPGSPTRPVLDSPTRTTSGLRISSRQSLASPSPSPSGLLSPGFTKRDYFQNKTYNKRIMSFKKENPEPPGSQLPSVAQAEETHVPGDQDAVSLLKQLVASVTSDDSDDSDEKPFEDEATMEDSIWNRLGELRFGDIWQRYNPNGEQLVSSSFFWDHPDTSSISLKLERRNRIS